MRGRGGEGRGERGERREPGEGEWVIGNGRVEKREERDTSL